MRITEKMMHKVADPLSKILYERGYRNFEQVETAFNEWLLNDDDDFIHKSHDEIVADFINFLKEYKYE